MTAALLDVPHAAGKSGTPGRYRIESYRTSTRSWEPMDRGQAAATWRPRPSAAEAAVKAARWVGFIWIPRMQVIDATSGAVVWRSPRPRDDDPADADAGDPLSSPYLDAVLTAARERMRAEFAAERTARTDAPAAAGQEEMTLW